ncbi:MAG: UbiD family decarboxylase [Candidatus Methanomethylophilaceae archaeon]|nr:UbiD family decarboxylase [Candidatus Methanomethylophilaceae archaeon]
MSVRAHLSMMDDVQVLQEPVDSDSNDVTRILQRDQDMTVHFKNLNGGEAAGNLLSTREKMAKAMNIPVADIAKHLDNAISHPVPTVFTDKPDFRHKLTEDVDLLSLPIPKYFPEDGGRYITAGVIVAEFEGQRNMSFHRMMVMDKNHLAVRLVPRHLFTMHKLAKKAGKELNIAICVGVCPCALLAAATSLDFGVDELEVASAIRKSVSGAPMAVGKTDNGITVPANADYVFEAKLTFETADEGPFVDITGTYDHIRKEPVIRVEKMWTCREPIFHLLLPGGYEHYLLMGMPREPMMFKTVRQAVPRTHAVRLTEGGCCWLHGVVSITKNKEGDGMNAIMAAFTGHPSLKQVIVVDDDIDIFDDRQVEWAVATRFQGNRMLRVPDAAGSSLDPSASGTTWKVGIDATMPLGKERDYRRAVLD